MQPIIHIGYPKTGTTWFQQRYFPFIKNTTYLPRQITFNNFVQPNSFDFDPIKTQGLFENIQTENLILSLEGLIGTVHSFGLNGLMTKECALRLYQVFPNGKIVIFIRNQIDMIASTYNQYIRGGGTYGMNKYLYHKNFQDMNGLTQFSFKHFEYHYIIDFYKSLFGANNVYVFLYDAFLEDSVMFVQQFSDKLNMEIDLNNLDYQKINMAYRSKIKFIAKITNLFTEQKMLNKYYIIHIPRWFGFSKRVLNFLNKFSFFGKHSNSEKTLGRKNLEFIKSYYKESNQKLIDEHKLTIIKNYNFPL